MNKVRKMYKTPTLVQVSLVPEEAVLVVCKNHENGYDSAANHDYCSWHGQDPGSGGDWKVCKGVTGS